jgi:N-acetylmuramoyl-L-alanine amidase
MGVWHLATRPRAAACTTIWGLVLLASAILIWPNLAGCAPQGSRVTDGTLQASAKTARSSGTPPAPARLATVRDIRHWSNPAYTRVVIDLDTEVEYRVGRLHNPDRLYFDLIGTRLSPQLQGPGHAVSDRLLTGIRVAQNQGDVVRVVLDLQGLHEYHAFSMHDPQRLVIDLQGEPGQPPAPPSAMAPAPTAKYASPPPPSGPEPRRRTSARPQRWHVVIDPGHGGKDPGAIGPSGVMEKEVVLDISKRLQALMQQEGQWQVTMTRDTDLFIPLKERTSMANAKGADLFVSIHANAAERPDLHGIETYFLDFATDERAMQTAARENATSLHEVSDLQVILRDLLTTSKRNESVLLAGSVQHALVEAPGGGKNGRDLGVKHAPFLVLIGAEMPAILIEIGFISNPTEERKIADPKQRDRMARAMLSGIKDYLAIMQGTSARQVSR